MVSEKLKKIARNLKKNIPKFVKKAVPAVKKDIKRYAKKSEQVFEKGASGVSGILAKYAKTRILNRQVFKKERPTLTIRNKPVISSFAEGSFYFNDEWEKELEQINPFAKDGFFWE